MGKVGVAASVRGNGPEYRQADVNGGRPHMKIEANLRTPIDDCPATRVLDRTQDDFGRRSRKLHVSLEPESHLIALNHFTDTVEHCLLSGIAGSESIGGGDEHS